MASVDVTRIASNIGALNALNSLTNINKSLAMHQTRLQTGKRINSAADDPAGLTIATKMLARSEGLKVALSNIGDASNMLSVAEGGMSKINDILVQIRSKAEQAASDTLGQTERQAIQTQLSAYAEQIDDIIKETKWNGVSLLDGTANKRFQTGVDDGEYTTWTQTTKHAATEMGVSTVVSANGASGLAGGVGVSLVNGNVDTFANLSRLATGSYRIKTLDVALKATQGKLTAESGSALVVGGGTVTVAAQDSAIATELTNGSHTLNVLSYVPGGTLTYNFDGGASATATVDTNAAVVALGSSVTIAMSDVTKSLSGSLVFDFVGKNQAKMALQTGDGASVAADSDGIAGGATGTYFYSTASGIFDTGRGVRATAGSLAQLQSVENTGINTFTYAQKSNYSVDVSTAVKASTYMATINTALDGVNASMASLGSLMARLSFKEEQIAVAQVNVESSYSRIMNANMAEEQVNASKFAILQQTATAMLAQANQAPQSLLSLFR